MNIDVAEFIWSPQGEENAIIESIKRENNQDYFYESFLLFRPIPSFQITTIQTNEPSKLYHDEIENLALITLPPYYEATLESNYADYQLLKILGVELPYYLKTEEGEFFKKSTLPGHLLSKFYTEEVYPILLKIQQ